MKISIIGSGKVGSTITYALLSHRVATEIVVVDINKKKVEGEVKDIEDSSCFFGRCNILGTHLFSKTKNSDIVIITVGVPQKIGETRLDLTSRNVGIFKNICKELNKYNKNPIYIIITNPVDIIAYFGKKLLNSKENRIFGTGTILDSYRFKNLLQEKFGVNSHNLHAHIIGEHGDNSFPLWSLANIFGEGLEKHFKLLKKEKEEIEEKVRNSAYKIIENKGFTSYGISAGVLHICKAIKEDSYSVLTLSTFCGNYGHKDVCLSVPCIINKDGIYKILKVNLSSEEKRNFKRAAGVIKKYLREV